MQIAASEPIMQIHILELGKGNMERKLLKVSLLLKELLNIQFEDWEDFKTICFRSAPEIIKRIKQLETTDIS